MDLQPIEIKLKECCLKCPHFSPDGMIGFGACASSRREIACGHMAVCHKYLEKEEIRIQEIDTRSKKLLEEIADCLDALNPDKIHAMSEEEYQAAKSRFADVLDKGYSFMLKADKKLKENGGLCAPDSNLAALKLCLFMFHTRENMTWGRSDLIAGHDN